MTSYEEIQEYLIKRFYVEATIPDTQVLKDVIRILCNRIDAIESRLGRDGV